MFDGLIEGNLARAICDGQGELIELRLRAGRPVIAITTISRGPVKSAGRPYVLSRGELDGIVARATNMSIYSVSDELLKGYIPYKGLRIGVGGEGVNDGGKPIGVKNITSLVIRVPRQIKTAADGVFDMIARGEGERARALNTLVISPPCGGKTTMLREIARKLSAFENVVIIDERGEIASSVDGMPTFDVGDSDVISGVPKSIAYENCVRAMSPEVMVTDELFGDDEVGKICDAVRAGVTVIASVHGDGAESVAKSKIFAPLFDVFDLAVTLSRDPVGQVKSAVKLR